MPDFIEAIAPLLGRDQDAAASASSPTRRRQSAGRRAALQARAEAAGIALNIAVVTGDDLMAAARRDCARRASREMFSGAALPDKLMSANAYLGAQPIAAALDRGADVVITGRCVDSAVTLGALVHAFGWSWDDYDQLAQGEPRRAI